MQSMLIGLGLVFVWLALLGVIPCVTLLAVGAARGYLPRKKVFWIPVVADFGVLMVGILMFIFGLNM